MYGIELNLKKEFVRNLYLYLKISKIRYKYKTEGSVVLNVLPKQTNFCRFQHKMRTHKIYTVVVKVIFYLFNYLFNQFIQTDFQMYK